MKQRTPQQILDNIIRLRDELGREPNTFDIDACPYLPSSRQIQRRLGGLQKVREHLGFTHINHASGAQRSATARQAQLRANKYELDIINKMIKRYPQVIRHFAYQQWVPDEKHYKNITCDAAIINGDHVIMFDFFFPSTKHSLDGCVRSKKNKLQKHPPSLCGATYEVIFVCTNPEMTLKDMPKLKDITVMDYETFKRTYLPPVRRKNFFHRNG